MEDDLLDGLYWEYLYNDGNDKVLKFKLVYVNLAGNGFVVVVRTLCAPAARRRWGPVRWRRRIETYYTKTGCSDCQGNNKHIFSLKILKFNSKCCIFRLRQLRVRNDSCDVHADFQVT